MFSIIFGVITLICMIVMLILYININNKLSNTLTLDKLKVNDIEIEKNIDINPDILIKGTYNFNKSSLKDKFKNFDRNNLKIFYIKNDDDKSKIPIELHLDELIYLLYTINKDQFMKEENKNSSPIDNIDHDEISADESEEQNEKENENEKENDEENKNENNEENENDENTKETFKNIPGYNIYYY